MSAALAACGLALAAALASGPSSADRKWIDGEVGAIRSDLEREVFLGLGDERARNHFRDRFWQARDPTPGTALNENRVEHDRRRLESSRLFDDAATAPRVRLYVALGAPAERIVFTRKTLWPIELWSYEQLTIPGLPGFFQLLLFRPENARDYQVYDPWRDGPVRLLRPEKDARPGRAAALRALHLVSGALDSAARSLLPGETAGADGETASSRRLLETLADLNNRLPVEVSYLLDPDLGGGLLPLGSYTHGASGVGEAGMLHYGVEVPPQRISLAAVGSQWEGGLFVTGGVFTGDGGRPVRAIDSEVDLTLEDGLYQNLADFPFAFEDTLDLLPGVYRLTLVVRDRQSGEAGVVSECVEVPLRRAAGLTVGPILLASRAVPSQDATRPFAFAGRNWHPAERGLFDAAGSLQAVFEVARGRDEPRGEPLAVRYKVLSGQQEELAGFDRVETDALGLGSGLLDADLDTIAPGDYLLRVELSAPDGGTATRAAAFSVRANVQPSNPWILTRNRPPRPDQRALDLALQHLARGETRSAIRGLDRLRAAEDTSPAVKAQASLKLAQLAIIRADYAAAAQAVAGLEVLPALLYLARAQSATGAHNEALATFGRALALSPNDPRILDAMVDELKGSRKAH